jgi:hypothetical protein
MRQLRLRTNPMQISANQQKLPHSRFYYSRRQFTVSTKVRRQSIGFILGNSLAESDGDDSDPMGVRCETSHLESVAANV